MSYSYDLLGRMLAASSTGADADLHLRRARPPTSARRGRSARWARSTTSPAGAPGSTIRERPLRSTMPTMSLGEMTEIRENGAGRAASCSRRSAYDDRGRRTQLTRGNGAITSLRLRPRLAPREPDPEPRRHGERHDARLRLQSGRARSSRNSRSNDAYSFAQANANIDEHAPNGLNQLTAIDGASVTYDDARGNVTAIRGSARLRL